MKTAAAAPIRASIELPENPEAERRMNALKGDLSLHGEALSEALRGSEAELGRRWSYQETTALRALLGELESQGRLVEADRKPLEERMFKEQLLHLAYSDKRRFKGEMTAIGAVTAAILGMIGASAIPGNDPAQTGLLLQITLAWIASLGGVVGVRIGFEMRNEGKQYGVNAHEEQLEPQIAQYEQQIFGSAKET